MVGVNGDPRSDDDRALTRAAAEVAARRGHEDALADERGAIIDARVATNMPIALSFLLARVAKCDATADKAYLFGRRTWQFSPVRATRSARRLTARVSYNKATRAHTRAA